MHYDRIPRAETGQHYLDVALGRGRKQAASVKGIRDKIALARAREKDRVRTIRTSLCTSLKKLHDAYPSFDRMGEFMRQVFALDMEPGRAKQALGGIQHAVTTIRALSGEHIALLARANNADAVMKLRNAYLGRIGSVLRQTEKHLRVLNEARAVSRNLPVVDEALFTVAIAGFPNVGKSTLLKKLTSASPDIQPYAFTTKGLNVGYFEHAYNRIQCIDTPGTLNRESPNAIERKADIANKYLASAIVYVFDPTEGSYPLEKQRELYERILELDKPVLVYVSKTDIASRESVSRTTDGLKAWSADAEEIRKQLIKAFREWV